MSDPSDDPSPRRSRDSLLDATERVIARDGFRGLTYRGVAAEAGVTHGLVAYHFGTRDRLIRAAVERAATRALEESMLEPRSGRLEDLARELPALLASEPDAQALQFEIVLEARRRPELREGARALYARYFATMTRALERVGAPADDATTRLVFAAIDGIVVQHLVFNDRPRTEQLIDRLHEVLEALTP